MRTTLFLLLAWLLTSYSLPHPLKMSYCIMTYSKQDKTLTIENRFFADDFQKCINKEYNQMYDIMHFHTGKEIRSVVDQYTNSHLVLKWNDKLLTFHCKSSVYDEDANLFYFRYSFSAIELKKSNQLSVQNKILLNYFTDQKNGVVYNLTSSISGKTTEFDHSKTTETIHF